MTIGDHPEYLALGFLRNQGMLAADETVTGIDHDEDLETVVVRTDGQTSYEEKLGKKTRTSGCAVGTVFGDMMEGAGGGRSAAAFGADLGSLPPRLGHQPHALALSRGGGDPRHGAVPRPRSTGLYGGCRPPQRRRQDRRLDVFRRAWVRGDKTALHHRPADLRDGDQDGADGHPCAGLAFGLHRLGGGDRPRGGADADRGGCAASVSSVCRARSAWVRDTDPESVPEEDKKHRRKGAET